MVYGLDDNGLSGAKFDFAFNFVLFVAGVCASGKSVIRWPGKAYFVADRFVVHKSELGLVLSCM